MYQKILDELKIVSIFPQELIWLDKGIKDVIRKGVDEDFNKIRKLCRIMGFKYLVVKEKRYGIPGSVIVYISKDSRKNKEAHKARLEEDYEKLGKLLSYPNCCIEALKMASILEKDPIIHDLDFKKLPFYTNMLHSMESRLVKEDFKTWFRLMDKGWDMSNMFLIPHIPCSFDCKESIKIGKETFRIIENDTNLAPEYIKNLKKPIIYFDKFRYTTIRPKKFSRDFIKYEYEGLPNLIDEDKIELIKRGSIIIKQKDEVSIEDETGEIGRLKNLNIFLFVDE